MTSSSIKITPTICVVPQMNVIWTFIHINFEREKINIESDQWRLGNYKCKNIIVLTTNLLLWAKRKNKKASQIFFNSLNKVIMWDATEVKHKLGGWNNQPFAYLYLISISLLYISLVLIYSMYITMYNAPISCKLFLLK